MAKQVGPVFFTGTIDGIIFYKVGDQYYSRSKGSYKSAKHMRRNPKYKRTMEKADQFGTASKLAQELYYRHVPKAARKQGVYGQLTGMVTTLFQEGKDKHEVVQIVINHCQTLTVTPKAKASTPKAQPQSILKATDSKPGGAKPKPRVKQARYLSRWHVKRNGRLHIPGNATNVHQQCINSEWQKK